MMKSVLLLMLPTLINAAGTLRVMTFNIWISGDNVEKGLLKIAKHILLLNPDVVALQEVEHTGVIDDLKLMLGAPWEGISRNDTYPDVGILTRHQIHEHSFFSTQFAMGAKLTINNKLILHYVNAHLDYQTYGPYAAYNKLVTNISQILQQEKARHENLVELFEHHRMQNWMNKSLDIPIVFCGDFNAPSHIDWQQETSESHGGWSVEWPTSKFMEKNGFLDSFRVINPNVTAEPGRANYNMRPTRYRGSSITRYCFATCCGDGIRNHIIGYQKAKSWSTVNKLSSAYAMVVEEPQDRIDFIFYRGKNLKPSDSFMYAGTEPLKPMPFHRKNDYPSDHYAFVTDFDIFY